MVSFRSLLVRTFAAILFALPATAADLSVVVADKAGKPADHAVVTLSPTFKSSLEASVPQKAVMKQQNTMFAPFVLPVKTGTSVSFPNLDEFRHHVYSFSKAKRLELRLYGQDESNELLFDTPGVVALGCNIHDNMLAYIYVTDDPYFLVADANGTVNFTGLTAGSYKLSVWHPDQKRKSDTYSQEINVTAGNNTLSVALEMRSIRRRQDGPDGKEYQ